MRPEIAPGSAPGAITLLRHQQGGFRVGSKRRTTNRTGLYLTQPDRLATAIERHHWRELRAKSSRARLGVPDPQLAVWLLGRKAPVSCQHVVTRCNHFPTPHPSCSSLLTFLDSQGTSAIHSLLITAQRDRASRSATHNAVLRTRRRGPVATPMMSNAGPLTTTFTAPSSCTTATGLYQIWPGTDRYFYEQGPLGSRTECFPSGYDPSPSQYYSPGLCPSGYTPACSSTEISSNTAIETAYTCCPTAAAYTCAGAPGDLDQSEVYLGCTTTFEGNIALAQITAISDGSTNVIRSTTESAGVGIGANSIAVRFRSGDFNSKVATTVSARHDVDMESLRREPLADSPHQASPSASVTLAAPDTATLPISSPTTPSEPNSSSTPGSGSTSQRAIGTNQAIGIGVGSAAAALIVAISAWLFLYLRRRKQRIRAQIETPIPPPAPPPKDRRFRSPPPNLDLGGSAGGSIASVARNVNGKMIRGPFELQSDGKEKSYLHGIFGAHYSSQSPASTPKSSDPLRSNPMTPSFWSPPSSFGFQPAELESPQRSVTSGGSGQLHGRAELASP